MTALDTYHVLLVSPRTRPVEWMLLARQFLLESLELHGAEYLSRINRAVECQHRAAGIWTMTVDEQIAGLRGVP